MNASQSSWAPVDVRVTLPSALLNGELCLLPAVPGLVVFAHGSGSGRRSPRNQMVARALNASGLGTLLFDLLTEDEERDDVRTARLRFDIHFLARRLAATTRWVRARADAGCLRLGYFGASTGAAAALVAAGMPGAEVAAIVSRGGRVDLAGPALTRVEAATLLIVGERDHEVARLNEAACLQLRCEKRLEVVPHATHLFEEPGALEEVARLAAAWFQKHLRPAAGASSPEQQGGSP